MNVTTSRRIINWISIIGMGFSVALALYFFNLGLFDDLNALFYKAILINEKIDLEIASGRYIARLGNTEENLKQFKKIIQKLNDYYKEFKRDK